MAEYTSSNELHCWEKLRQSDPSALAYLYDTYIDSLFLAALKVTGDRELAKDALQDVFIEIWTYRHTIGVIRSTQSYLIKVLRNILFKKLRSTYSVDVIGQEEMGSPDSNIEELIISADRDEEESQRLKVAVSLLTQRQKQILELRFNRGLTYDQIADELEMNYQSVNNLAFRTLRRLRLTMTSLLGLLLVFQ